jgi:hypothetical protein
MAIIDNTLASKVDTFDASVPLARAAVARNADMQARNEQFKLIQSELGAEARGLQAFVNTPEFPERWAQATDRLAQKGVLPPQMHQQLRNTPSPLMLKSIIQSTQANGQEPEAIRTVKAAGIDPASAEGRAALFPKVEGETKFEEVYDEATGLPRKALVNTRTGAQKPVGGVKQTQLEPIDREQAKKDVARVELYKTEADQGRGAAADVAQLRELRKGVGYEGGMFADKRATVAGWFGSGEGQALRSKATEIQLSFSEKTKGAITDREQAMFKGATPGLEMTDDAAETVLNGMDAAAKRTIERGKFFENYMTEHRSLAGAQEAWDRFLKEKPILVGDDKGKLKVNEKNIDAWKPYVGKSDKPKRGGPGGGQSDAIQRAREAIAKGASREAVMKRLQENGIDPGGL